MSRDRDMNSEMTYSYNVQVCMNCENTFSELRENRHLTVSSSLNYYYYKSFYDLNLNWDNQNFLFFPG